MYLSYVLLIMRGCIFLLFSEQLQMNRLLLNDEGRSY